MSSLTIAFTLTATILLNVNAQTPPVKSTKFINTSSLLDAALNSINSLNSLIKKENYRNKVISFNNPATSDIGFSLETEIQNALRPILEKAKTINQSKFSSIINSLVRYPLTLSSGTNTMGTVGLFSSLLGVISNLAISEKRITKQDLDSAVINMNKYFIPYEKLNQVNRSFTQDIEKFNTKLQELIFDTHEYILDLIIILYSDTTRQQLKDKSIEELMIRFLDKNKIELQIRNSRFMPKYPGDGIKTAKEIVYSIQKLFEQYQDIYKKNYTEIKTILLQGKELGNGVDNKQIDNSVHELDTLFTDSKDADILNLRILTLLERLRILVNTEQIE